MKKKKSKPWYARVVWTPEGVDEQYKCKTKGEAQAYKAGFESARERGEEYSLDDYFVHVTQDKLQDES